MVHLLALKFLMLFEAGGQHRTSRMVDFSNMPAICGMILRCFVNFLMFYFLQALHLQMHSCLFFSAWIGSKIDGFASVE